MARIPQITDRNQVAPADQAHFDTIAASRGGVRGPFSIYMYSPEMAERAAHLGAYVRFEAQLPTAQVELATLAAAREFDCEYAWGSHEGQARSAGVSEEAIEVVVNRRLPDNLTPEEATIIRYVRELLQNKRVTDETFAKARELFGDRGMVELTGTAGYYGMLACILNAFEVDAPAGARPIRWGAARP